MKIEEWLGILRHGLTCGGGGLVTNGLLTAGDLQAGIGALMTIIGLVWSVYNKRQARGATSPPVARVAGWLLAGILSIAMFGCATDAPLTAKQQAFEVGSKYNVVQGLILKAVQSPSVPVIAKTRLRELENVSFVAVTAMITRRGRAPIRAP